MRQNYKVLALTTALAVGMALAGCGGVSSSTAASSTASSVAGSVPASSAAASSETDAVSPIANEEGVDDLVSGTSSYKVYASLTDVGGGNVTLDVYSYDAYEEDDVKKLQEGGVIRIHDETTGEWKDMTIESLEESEYGDYIINGGIEEGGMELTKDRGVYRTMTFDGYPVYYKVGSVSLPLAEDVTLEDSSSAPDASNVVTTGAADVEAYIASDDNWTVCNTTYFVQDGHVFDIQRIWVP